MHALGESRTRPVKEPFLGYLKFRVTTVCKSLKAGVCVSDPIFPVQGERKERKSRPVRLWKIQRHFRIFCQAFKENLRSTSLREILQSA